MIASFQATEALTNPLSVIDTILSSTHSTNPTEQVSKSFQTIFASDQAIYQIPSITNPSTPPGLLPNSSLVRFRCMIQDTGLGTELYAPYASSGKPTAYRESLDLCGSSSDPVEPSQLSERELVYAVEIPGESQWVRTRFDGPLDKGLEYGLESLKMSSKSETGPRIEAWEHERTRRKFPIAGSKHLGAVLKFYEGPAELEQIRTASMLEVVGILGWTEFGVGLDEQDLVGHPGVSRSTQSADAPPPSRPHIPCIHVIFHRAPPSLSSTLPSALPDVRPRAEVRERLVKYIARKAFDGDELAAQYLLCAMTSKIHTRVSGHTLGALPLNLVYPKPNPKPLADLLSNLLPRLSTVPLTIPALNARALFPVSDTDSLLAGPLQLATSTVVLLDALAMDEGQLGTMGLRNVACLARLVDEGKLEYSFPYSQFLFDAQLPLLLLSLGSKTFVDGFWTLPVAEASACKSNVDTDADECEPCLEELESWRMWLEELGRAGIIIPQSLASEIQETFVSIRRGAATAAEAEQAMSQADLARRLELARLVGLQFGRQEVSLEDWQWACKMEKMRKVRLG
ncbi:hypothetical protein CROQUDRAFT_656113 [Cronartium quercuum f. sp. fusiforme G11]|uniref:Mini-chromosome maintenance complex-binding protein n=1 Tax=Cronartium quercuum f. sp. fusiforme G11 TaxID=708437 RepID=A0A9P6TCH8_9BASI|nr:hypothetical protein CROQUDRAFT_656113 [Cronartium quercuum f. sp. fusiforme G11]